MPVLVLDRTIDNSYGKINNAFKSDKNLIKKTKPKLDTSLPNLKTFNDGYNKKLSNTATKSSYLDSYLKENGDILESLLKSKLKSGKKSLKDIKFSNLNSISQRQTPKKMYINISSRLSNQSVPNSTGYADKHLNDLVTARKQRKNPILDYYQGIDDFNRYRQAELLKNKIRLHYYNDHKNFRNFNSRLSLQSLNSEKINNTSEISDEELKQIEVKGFTTIRIRDPITAEVKTIKKTIQTKENIKKDDQHDKVVPITPKTKNRPKAPVTDEEEKINIQEKKNDENEEINSDKEDQNLKEKNNL